MEMEQLKKALRAQIEEYKTLAFELSDQMAREPEIGSQEYKSSAAIVKLLRDHGVEVEYPFAGYRTAFRGQICPERKVRMALLAEYDALRGLGHACGHCASGSGSVLAALAFRAEASCPCSWGSAARCRRSWPRAPCRASATAR